jgi:hypothetical protein
MDGFPDHGDARYFTINGYRNILTRALELGYLVVPFRNFTMPKDRPVLLLRHDLDHSLLRAEALAEIEATLGLASTFFIQTDCEFYNLLSRESRRLIYRLVELGHEIGLHYTADRYRGQGGSRAIVGDLRLLEDLSGSPVVSASQHIPIDGEPIALSDYIQNEAYEARFTAYPMTYISDSLMVWRDATPHDLLDRFASFQFLSHPETWYGSRNMEDVLGKIQEEETQRLRTRHLELLEYYRLLLSERQERDRLFRERKHQEATKVSSGRRT